MIYMEEDFKTSPSTPTVLRTEDGDGSVEDGDEDRWDVMITDYMVTDGDEG